MLSAIKAARNEKGSKRYLIIITSWLCEIIHSILDLMYSTA